MQKDIKTVFFKINDPSDGQKELELAGKMIREGGLVAFPTETVYGLGGNALDPSASERIYKAKGRPSDNPLIVHISSTEEIYPLVSELPKTAVSLMEAFWPGPMTLVLKKSDVVPATTTGGLNTVAIRMPSHPVARALIKAAGVPIAAPSANSSGRPSPTKAVHVLEDLDGKVDMIIDGGESDIGLESTIIDLTGDTPEILRPGYISEEEIKKAVGSVKQDPTLFARPDADAAPKAPGMKYRHYAPKAKMFLIKGNKKAALAEMQRQAQKAEKEGKKVGILCEKEDAALFEKYSCFVLCENENEEEIAHRLFSLLRETDKAQIDVLFSLSYKKGRLGDAIENRMLKAAGYNVLEAKDEL